VIQLAQCCDKGIQRGCSGGTDIVSGLGLLSGIEVLRRIDPDALGQLLDQTTGDLVVSEVIRQFLECVQRGRRNAAENVGLQGIEQGNDLVGTVGDIDVAYAGGIIDQAIEIQGTNLILQFIDGRNQIGFLGRCQVGQDTDGAVQCFDIAANRLRQVDNALFQRCHGNLLC
jgi:hypothetical protein